MRLFVAVWPTPEVVVALERLPRPEHPAVRWTPPDQWHVTLRFLGDVDDGDVPAIATAVQQVGARLPPGEVRAGPCTARLGKGPLVLPVAGLDDLATEVVAATRDHGVPPDHRPFHGHLTLARGRGRRVVPASLAGAELGATWPVTQLHLVCSHLGGQRARYETIAVAPLEG